jgi:putative transcriptional regulator
MAGRGDTEPSGFGGKLSAMRTAAGLSQGQLADRAELHVNTVARLERGENEPAWPVVLKLAAALGVTCEAFTGTGGPTGKTVKRGRGRPKGE